MTVRDRCPPSGVGDAEDLEISEGLRPSTDTAKCRLRKPKNFGDPFMVIEVHSDFYWPTGALLTINILGSKRTLSLSKVEKLHDWLGKVIAWANTRPPL